MYDDRVMGAPTVKDEGLLAPAAVDTTAKVESVRETKVLLPETEIALSNGQGVSPVVIDFVEGETYVVLWNGVEYTETAAIMADGGVSAVYVGNTVFLGGADNGKPFFIGTAQGATMLASMEETAVVGVQSVAHVLRLGYAGCTFDVPHTAAPKTVMGAREFTEEEAASSGYGLHTYNVEYAPIEEGKAYKLTINGETVETTAFRENEVIGLKFNEDGGIMFPVEEMGKSFSIHALALFGEGWSSFSIAIEDAEGEIRKLDAKYLPDTLYLTSPNGTKYKLAVADDGTLSAVAVE